MLPGTASFDEVAPLIAKHEGSTGKLVQNKKGLYKGSRDVGKYGINEGWFANINNKDDKLIYGENGKFKINSFKFNQDGSISKPWEEINQLLKKEIKKKYGDNAKKILSNNVKFQLTAIAMVKNNDDVGKKIAEVLYDQFGIEGWADTTTQKVLKDLGK